MKKLAVFFPGIGYTLEKPLLYYSRKLAKQHGYEIKTVPYENLPEMIRGNREKMEEAFKLALGQTREALEDVELRSYDEVLFVGKSIGSIVAAKLAQEEGAVPIRLLLYTPLEDTFSFGLSGDGPGVLVFSGTEDPWVGGKDSRIARKCYEKHIRCISLDGANHSLETGDVLQDLEYLKLVMQMTDKFLM